ncbi:MAG TPA: hypothetical protein DCS43_15535 [Verrucomicrobia bacterium]|nr:hypothetical protein [Verrucomicrobiota bacterium]
MRIEKDPILDAWELAESEQTKRPTRKGVIKPCNRHRLLIVDDEDSIRRVTLLLLQKSLDETVQFDMATNGREAINLFSLHHHKVIMMDLSMPELDGEEAAMQILDICEESQWESPAIIFRTGYAPPGNIRNLVSGDPAHCLLRKPVRNQTLVTAVRKRMA